VTVIGRRSVAVDHPKLREVLHDDFSDFAAVADAFADHTVALFCVGAYTGAVSDEAFRRVTVDYTVAFARALHARSPGAAFCFLSGQGADPTERSRMSFARYKGAAEKALLALGFPRVHIFRPGYIYPPTPRDEPNFGYRMMRGLYPVLRSVYPNVGVPADDLARVMVEAGLNGTPGHAGPILENAAIRALA
jgi:uncharacterized protein YbjT (DUF2867 family)